MRDLGASVITSDPFLEIPWADIGPDEVILTEPDIAKAIAIEDARMSYNKKCGSYRSLYRNENHAYLGAIGEVAGSIYFNIAYDGSLGDFDAADIGSSIEIKTIDNPHHSLGLKKTKRMKPDSPHVLVYVFGMRARMMGWMMGCEIMQDRYWRINVPNPAWFVPQSDLHSMAEWGWGVFN